MRNHNAAAHHQRHIQRLLLFLPRCAQPIRLDDVVINAIVTAQPGRYNQPHQLLVLRWNGSLQIRVVIDVVKTLHQKVVGLLDIHIQPRARRQKAPGYLAFLRNLFLSELIGGFFSVRSSWRRA